MTWERELQKFFAARRARDARVITPEEYAVLRRHFYAMCACYRVTFHDGTLELVAQGAPRRLVSRM